MRKGALYAKGEKQGEAERSKKNKIDERFFQDLNQPKHSRRTF
jgi:hypothetical protein